MLQILSVTSLDIDDSSNPLKSVVSCFVVSGVVVVAVVVGVFVCFAVGLAVWIISCSVVSIKALLM